MYQGLDHFIGSQWLTHHYWLAGRIGAGLIELGDHNKGKELVNKAVEFFRTTHSAEYGFVLSARSHAHLLDRDLEQAEADYEEAQPHEPYMTDSVLRRLHGMRLDHALGDQSAAKDCLRQAIERSQEMGCGPGTALYERVTRLSTELNINL